MLYIFMLKRGRTLNVAHVGGASSDTAVVVLACEFVVLPGPPKFNGHGRGGTILYIQT
jgi:hypothetical protein